MAVLQIKFVGSILLKGMEDDLLGTMASCSESSVIKEEEEDVIGAQLLRAQIIQIIRNIHTPSTPQLNVD